MINHNAMSVFAVRVKTGDGISVAKWKAAIYHTIPLHSQNSRSAAVRQYGVMECPLGSIRLLDSRMGLCIEFKQFGLVFGSLFFRLLFWTVSGIKKSSTPFLRTNHFSNL